MRLRDAPSDAWVTFRVPPGLHGDGRAGAAVFQTAVALELQIQNGPRPDGDVGVVPALPDAVQHHGMGALLDVQAGEAQIVRGADGLIQAR